MESKFICPITHQYFYEPVLCANGIIYEKDAISKWFKVSNKSPISNVSIINIMIKSYIFCNDLDEFYKNNQEAYKHRYATNEMKLQQLDTRVA